MNSCYAIVHGRNRTDGLLDKIRLAADCVAFTEYAGHARELASRARNYEMFLVVGGDGTVREAVSGMDRSRQRVGVVPVGRGNSLARDLGLTTPGAALEAIRVGLALPIDLMEVAWVDSRGHQHLSTATTSVAVGYPAEATRAANATFRWAGRKGYLVASVWKAWTARAIPTVIAYDDSQRKRRALTGCLINNTRHLAYFLAFPDASCRDGYLDVMELHARFLQQMIHNIATLLRRKTRFAPIARKTRSIRLELTQPGPLMVDGDIIDGVVTVDIRVLPSACVCYAHTSS